MIQQAPKSSIMTPVIMTLKSVVKGTSLSLLLSSGMNSVAQEKATAETDTRPQYMPLFSRMDSRKGRPW